MPGFESVVPAGGATSAVFATEPLAAVTSAETVSVKLPPLGSAGIVSPLSRPADGTVAGHAAPAAARRAPAVFVSPLTANIGLN